MARGSSATCTARVLAVLVAAAACASRRGVDAELWGQHASGDAGSFWDNLIASSAWRADEPPPPPTTTTTERPAAPATLACNYSDWRPLAAAWPERLQEWDRVDAQPSEKPPRPFRPSQPLVVRPAPAPAAAPTPVRAPPCFAAIQLPRPYAPSAPASPGPPLNLHYSPDPLPPQALDAADGLSRCLWTLVAPPGYNVTAAVSMGAWGRGASGVVHLYAQTAAGELSPVLSLHAPAQSSAEVRTRSGVAVLSTALPASATFTLRVALAPASPAPPSAALADTLQPPAPTRPWGRPMWNPARPYPASQGHVDAETVDLTHQQQHTANCVVAEQHAADADEGFASTPPPVPPLAPAATANATDDDQPPLPASKPTATTGRPSTSTTSTTTTGPASAAEPGAGTTPGRDKTPATTPTPAPTKAATAAVAPTPAPTTTKKPGR